MKTIGLIGGTTWISTIEYYRIINRITNEKLGGLNSAKIFLYSMNFEEFKNAADISKLETIADTLSETALKLENAGAECIVICANTAHIVADIVKQKIHIPLIHIAEVTAKEIKSRNISKVALLGTKITMEQNFYKDKLFLQQIDTIIPDKNDREFINKSIFNELGKGIFKADTKDRYIKVIDKLIEQGAKGVIFGCTEIPLLIHPDDLSIPAFDTTFLHSKAAVEFSLGCRI